MAQTISWDSKVPKKFITIVAMLGFSQNPRPCAGQSHSHGGGGVSSLRVLRLLRVFRSMKLLRQVEGLNKIVNIVLKVSKASMLLMWIVSVPLLLIFVFIYCLLLLRFDYAQKMLLAYVKCCCRLLLIPIDKLSVAHNI